MARFETVGGIDAVLNHLGTARGANEVIVAF